MTTAGDPSARADDQPPPAEHPPGLKRSILIPLIGAASAAALIPLDGAISRALTSLRPGGDLQRELELIQQFGSPTTIGLAALIIWRLDTPRLRRVLDWALAAALAAAACFALKMALGRPRPKFVGEHLDFLGPFQTYTVGEGHAPLHAWEFWQSGVADIWSMPSSHAAAAAVASVVLSRLYPRLVPVAAGWLVVVALARVILKAHYASDVVVGAVLGWVIADFTFRRSLGRRLFRLRPTGPTPPVQ